MADQHAYLRFPSIRGDTVAFVADDDIWLGQASGGTARRLTTDHAPAADPKLSADGSLIAYASRRDGAPEVYLAGTGVAATGAAPVGGDLAGDGNLAGGGAAGGGAAGGEVRRLTYFGDMYTRVIGWTDDNRVLAISAAGQPFRSRTWAYAIPADGGGAAAERLGYGPVTRLARGPGGAVVLGVNQYPRRGAAWKRYRGGTAAALWIDADGSGAFAPYLRHLDGQLEAPVFVGDRLVFVSDHEGTGNIYSVLADGSDLRRHTDHRDFYARAAASDGRSVVYQCAGRLLRLADLAADSAPSPLDIRLGAPRRGRARQTLRAQDELAGYAPDYTGRASAAEVRGAVYWLTHRNGPARYLAGGSGTRARLARVAGRGAGARVVFITDADGEDALEVRPATGAGGTGAGGTGANGSGAAHAGAAAAGAGGTAADPAAPRRFGSGQLGRVLDLAVAPDGGHAALATHDGRVILANLSTGELRVLAESAHGDAGGLSFAPDSRFLAWAQAGPGRLRHIRLAQLDGPATDATPLRFDDHDPVFTRDGKYLAFLSVRTFDPVYDAHVFGLSFPAGTRPYLITLAAETPSPFDAELGGRPRTGPDGDPDSPRDGDPAAGRADASAGGPDPAAATPAAGTAAAGTPAAAGPELGTVPPVRVDFDGLADRVAAFPVPAGRYSRLRAAHDGLLWLAEPVLGVLGEERSRPGAAAPRPKLIRYDLVKDKAADLVEALDSFEVSGDGRAIVVQHERRLRVLPADRKVSVPAAGEDADPADVVSIDLQRIRLELDPPAEWRQMFDEAARLMRDHYWIADMAGVDWDQIVARYRPLLDQIATRDDFSDLIWEVQGELGTSHAYEQPPERPVEAERRLGQLGADFERDTAGSWRVSRVLPGETSVRAARSPLRAPGAAVQPGDIIVAVDGRLVDAVSGPPAMLVGAAGKPVELTVRRDGTGETAEVVIEVVVEPLADERPLRYQDWVAGRRAAVHAATGGRVGYLHLPDMMATGWAELHRDLRVEVAREGLIVDVRDNGGGHVSELVLEKLARTVQAWVTSRHLTPRTYPRDSPRGPRVLVTNEQAGSDGDIVTAGFKQRDVGPVVGTRTWGGVIGIDGRYDLVDRSSVTQPRYAFWFYGLQWGVENFGVDPDVDVPFRPQDWAAGRDPQLDRAVELVLAALADQPAARPPDPRTRPGRAAPDLPPRPVPGSPG